MLKTQIKPGSVVLFHDTYSSTVDVVYQFIPVLKANGYHLVTVSQLLGPRAPGSSYGGRENGPPANDIHDIPPGEIPTLPDTPSPKPMPNLPITDIPDQNSGRPEQRCLGLAPSGDGQPGRGTSLRPPRHRAPPPDRPARPWAGRAARPDPAPQILCAARAGWWPS